VDAELTARALLGDPVPGALAALYAGLDEGRAADAAAAFAEDALCAVPRPGGHEVDPRLLAEGRAAIAELFAQRSARGDRHRVLLCACDRASCLVEGVIESAPGRPERTFAASLQLDARGLITRYLAFDCEPVGDPDPAVGAGWPASAATVVDRYYAALAAADFEAAAGCFSERVVYCHPPYQHTGITDQRRVYFRGRAELLAGFRKRGKTSFHHIVEASLQRGPNCLFETLVPGLPGGGAGSAISSLSLDDQGRIDRYVAFYCEPAVARR
jgi:hypothetical protein